MPTTDEYMDRVGMVFEKLTSAPEECLSRAELVEMVGELEYPVVRGALLATEKVETSAGSAGGLAIKRTQGNRRDWGQSAHVRARRAREKLTPVSPRTTDEVRTDVGGAVVAPRPSGADGLLHIVAGYLRHHEDNGAAGEGAQAPSAQVVIHLDKDLGASADAMAASLDDGTHVSAEVLRRVACDGGLVVAVVDEQAAVLDVGRRTRAIPTAIKRALWLRDQGCRFPGCANRRFVHGHHIQQWFHGGRARRWTTSCCSVRSIIAWSTREGSPSH